MSAESETVVDGRGRCSRHKNRWGRGDKEHEWVREGGRGAEGLCISGVRNCCQLIRVLQMAQAYLHRQQAAICLQWSDALSTYHVLHSSLYLWRITLPKLLLLLQGHRKWKQLNSQLPTAYVKSKADERYILWRTVYNLLFYIFILKMDERYR